MGRVTVAMEADGVARLTADRPEKLNAIDSAMLADLHKAFDDLAGDVRVRVVVITGAGDRAFIAGGDVAEMRDLLIDQAPRFVYAGQA